MAKSPNWTREELDILAEVYPKLGKSLETQKHFPNRTLEGIALKASRMGFKVINNIRKGKTNAEYVEALKQTNFESLEEYKGSTTSILHKCKICNHEWHTRPQHALKLGARCPICDINSRTNSLDKVDSLLDSKNILRHSDYLGALKPLVVEHIDCGYMWTTKYAYIKEGSGCPLCNKGFGYSYSKENLPTVAYLYLLLITTNSEKFYKVGVTIRSVESRVRELKNRLKQDIVDIKILEVFQDTGINILIKEEKILKSSNLIKHKSKSKFEGSTELLSFSNSLDSIKKEIYG